MTAIFDVVGIFGGYLVSVKLLGMSPGTYFGEMRAFVDHARHLGRVLEGAGLRRSSSVGLPATRAFTAATGPRAWPARRPRPSCSPPSSSWSSTTSSLGAPVTCPRDPHREPRASASAQQAVLRGVDLDVATAEIMVIIGRSGGGKSVLLKHLVGLLRPDAGRGAWWTATDIARAARRAPSTGPAALRRRVPGRGPLRLDDRRSTTWPSRCARRRRGGPRRRSRRRVEEKLDAGRAGGHGPQEPRRDLGRHAQARGDRPGARHRARGRLLRRADHRARPHPRQHDPPPDPRPAPEVPLHGGHGEPRDPGDLRDRRPGGHAARGASSSRWARRRPSRPRRIRSCGGSSTATSRRRPPTPRRGEEATEAP